MSHSLQLPYSVAHQDPLSMEFSRQEYQNGLPCPPPRDLPNSGMELTSLKSPTLAAGSLLLPSPGKPLENTNTMRKLNLTENKEFCQNNIPIK